MATKFDALEALTRTAFRAGAGDAVEFQSPPESTRTVWRLGLGAKQFLAMVLVLSVLAGVAIAWLGTRPIDVHAVPARETDSVSVTSPPPSEPPAVPSPSESVEEIGTSPEPATLVVYVSGEVVNARVVHVPTGSRVTDAVALAGGLTADADVSAVNMARLVTDGEHIHIPAPGDPPRPSTPPAPDGAVNDGESPPGLSAPINLNTATGAELETLPGIGPSLSQRIIDYREQHGQFASIDQLLEVSGIGESKFTQLKEHVVVG